jgi:hypothetical protein
MESCLFLAPTSLWSQVPLSRSSETVAEVHKYPSNPQIRLLPKCIISSYPPRIPIQTSHYSITMFSITNLFNRSPKPQPPRAFRKRDLNAASRYKPYRPVIVIDAYSYWTGRPLSLTEEQKALDEFPEHQLTSASNLCHEMGRCLARNNRRCAICLPEIQRIEEAEQREMVDLIDDMILDCDSVKPNGTLEVVFHGDRGTLVMWRDGKLWI